MQNRINYEDLILHLYLVDKIENRRGNLFVAKMIYLFEEDLFKKRMIGPSYLMYKDNYGPYNTAIKEDLMALGRNYYLEISPLYFRDYDEVFDLYKNNNNTSQFLKDIDDLIQEHSAIFTIFDTIINEFGGYSAKGLKNYVYSLEATGLKNIKIQDYNYKDIILNPYLIKYPVERFYLDEDWYDTIEILLDPKMQKQLKKSLSDLLFSRPDRSHMSYPDQ